jgi:hypothetical protein
MKPVDIKAIDTIVDLSKAGFKPLAQAKPRHFAAIGRFLTTVSNEIDVPLVSCLQTQIAANEDGITRIVLGGMTIGDVMSTIRRIAMLRNPGDTVVADINKLFEEISVLREHRNVVAHNTFLVKGNRLAFHNAISARTEAQLDVYIYRLDELDEFVRYSKNLGYRIAALGGRLVPEYTPPYRQSLLIMWLHQMQMKWTLALIKAANTTTKQKMELKELNEAAHKAVTEFVEATKPIDVNYAKLQKAASATTNKLSAALMTFDAPDPASLREIPARLQKQSRTRSKGSARSS